MRWSVCGEGGSAQRTSCGAPGSSAGLWPGRTACAASIPTGPAPPESARCETSTQERRVHPPVVPERIVGGIAPVLVPVLAPAPVLALAPAPSALRAHVLALAPALAVQHGRGHRQQDCTVLLHEMLGRAGLGTPVGSAAGPELRSARAAARSATAIVAAAGSGSGSAPGPGFATG